MSATRMVAASVFAVLAATAPGSAGAADLYGDNYRYQDQGQDYDEAEPPRYAERYRDDGYAYRGSTKDGYLPPPDRAPRFSDNGRYDEERYGRGDRYGCAPRWQVRNRLTADGWRNFERLAVRDRVLVVRAERPNGRPFDLKLDRCTGEIVDQRPSYSRGYGAYAPGPRRYGWAY